MTTASPAPQSDSRTPRSRAPQGASARVWVPLQATEEQALKDRAEAEGRTTSGMARVIYLAGLEAIEAKRHA